MSEDAAMQQFLRDRRMRIIGFVRLTANVERASEMIDNAQRTQVTIEMIVETRGGEGTEVYWVLRPEILELLVLYKSRSESRMPEIVEALSASGWFEVTESWRVLTTEDVRVGRQSALEYERGRHEQGP